jgi:hypothetical protein
MAYVVQTFKKIYILMQFRLQQGKLCGSGSATLYVCKQEKQAQSHFQYICRIKISQGFGNTVSNTTLFDGASRRAGMMYAGSYKPQNRTLRPLLGLAGKQISP